MAVVNGNDLVILVSKTSDNHIKFAHSREVSLSYSCEMVEVTTENTDTWREVIPGVRTTTMSFSGLTDYGTVTDRFNITDLADFLLEEDELNIQFRSGDNEYLGCKGYVSEISVDGSVDGYISYSGTITSTGELQSLEPFGQHFLLKEDGDFLLQENGDKIIILV